eukprot:scaffold57674_cov60-Cyclotella_meneghiniana.AAC.3
MGCHSHSGANAMPWLLSTDGHGGWLKYMKKSTVDGHATGPKKGYHNLYLKSGDRPLIGTMLTV